MKNDEFGDRMKAYEKALQTKLDRTKYACMRIDGRSFSKFTKKLVKNKLIEKPRDLRFERIFIEATKMTAKEFNFCFAFHQSDEVSFYFPTLENDASQYPFDGKIMKLTSVVASFFTSCFMSHFIMEYNVAPAGVSFDARLVEFPTKAEAVNMLVWRYQDARRNLIQDIAHFAFGHKALHKVPTTEKFRMIGSPANLRPGNFIKRIHYLKDETLRSKYDVLEFNFDKANWDDRVHLIYGENHDV